MIPNKYIDEGGKVVASYSFSEIATGKGVVRYYGASINGQGGKKILTQNTIDSQDNYTTLTGNTTNTNNFDLLFNNNAIIEGDAFISWTPEVGAATTVDAQAFRIYRVSGSSVLSIVQLGATVSGSTLGAGVSQRGLQRISIPRTVFKSGDTLRLQHEITITGTTAPRLFHDPTNRVATAQNDSYTGAVGSTILAIDIPFKIDL